MRADVHLGPVNLGANAGKRTGQTTGPVRVIFNGQEVRADAGITLLDAARRNNIDLRSYCGGNCSCGTCRLEVVKGQKNLSRREGLEEMVLGPDFVQKGQRLACQAQVFGDVEVRIPTHF